MESLQSPPTKRRALAALDANAMSSPRHGATALHDKLAIPASVSSASVAAAPGSPRKTDLAAAAAARKRALEDVADANAPPTPTSANKRTCVEPQTEYEQQEDDMGVDVDDEEDDEEANNSPDTSSIFDTSANDASWATAATDAASTDLPPLQASVPLLPPPPPPQQQSRRSLTREQAREKAEILRLRLGLASYKLRTGQTSVPLDDLQLKPLPPRVRVHGPERAPAEARTTDEEEEEQQQQQQTKDEQEDVAGKEGSQGDGDEDMDAAADAPSLPRISPSKAMATPRRTQLLALEDEDAERRLTSSALRGGAANGLLSLAMSASKQV